MHFENANPVCVLDDRTIEDRRVDDRVIAKAKALLDRAVAAETDSRLVVDVSVEMVLRLAHQRPTRAVVQILSHVCVLMQRRCVACADRPHLRDWIEIHERLHERLVEGLPRPTSDVRRAHFELDLDVARAWDRLFLGGLASSIEVRDLEALASESGRQKAARVSVHVSILLAFRSLADGQSKHAIVMARRAVDFAQADPSTGHDLALALMVLARSYRLSAQPHLGLAVLGTIRPEVAGLWADWIQWERCLAGGTRARAGVSSSSSSSAPSPEASMIGEASRLLGRVLAAVTGHLSASGAAEIDSAIAALKTCVSRCPFLDAEVVAVLAVLDVTSEHVPAAVQDWVRGSTSAAWCGFEAMELPVRALPARAFASAMVLGMPGAPGRRFLSSGAAMVPNAQKIENPQTSPVLASTRSETGVAVLALAGPEGMSCEEFFRAVYGLRFSPKRHQSVLDVLCYRMRLLVGDAGEVHRARRRSAPGAGVGESKMLLVLKRPIVVPDPRCAFSMTDRILHVVAMSTDEEGVWATRISSELQLPLRTAQSVVQDLVTDGQCMALRDGRHVRYLIQTHLAPRLEGEPQAAVAAASLSRVG